MYWYACIAVFALTYVANILTITVGYHRGLAHRALTLHPGVKRLVVTFGWWLTGLDPKAWVVMHRMHHAHSDADGDPHRPGRYGLFSMLAEQYRGMSSTIAGLRFADARYTRFARDLDFPLQPRILRGRWFLPYVVHAIASIGFGVSVGWVFAVAYFVGVTSHPLQGALVNWLGHAHGGRNFDTPDDSRNNVFAAWFIFGEGFQNNHHRYPSSARFDYRRSELDVGYAACVMFDKLGLVVIDRNRLMPRAGAAQLTSGGQQVDDEHEQQEADAPTTVVADAGTGPVATTTEQQHQDDQNYY